MADHSTSVYCLRDRVNSCADMLSSQRGSLAEVPSCASCQAPARCLDSSVSAGDTLPPQSAGTEWRLLSLLRTRRRPPFNATGHAVPPTAGSLLLTPRHHRILVRAMSSSPASPTIDGVLPGIAAAFVLDIVTSTAQSVLYGMVTRSLGCNY